MAGAGFDGIYYEGTYADYSTIERLASPGHLRIQITPSLATVDYISSSNTSGTATYSYTIAPNGPVTTYTLTTAVNPGAGGSINPAAGTNTYNEGTVVNVTATANTGYALSSWSGTGACSGTTNPCAVTMDGNKTITANFSAVTTYTLTTAVSPSGGGTINPAAGTSTYNSGTVVNVTATANTGYELSSWSGTGACAGTTNPCAVTMNSNKTITANFSAVTTITFTGTELLGRPEADRISISCVPASAATIRYQYSTTAGGPYTNSSSVAATAGAPAVVTITGLTANTHYYYRMQYSTDGGSNWTSRTEKSFWTQRAKGSTFSFDITTDSHINIQLGNQIQLDEYDERRRDRYPRLPHRPR